MFCLQEAVITKDFTLPLSKEAFKSTLEAYSIGVPKERPCPKSLVTSNIPQNLLGFEGHASLLSHQLSAQYSEMWCLCLESCAVMLTQGPLVHALRPDPHAAGGGSPQGRPCVRG